jgi:hypothetical protein
MVYIKINKNFSLEAFQGLRHRLLQRLYIRIYGTAIYPLLLF